MQKKTLQMKKVLRTALLVLLLNVAGIGKSYAQTTFTVDDLNYSVNNDEISVTVIRHVDGTSATGPLNIPESVSYGGHSYDVTAIGEWAFGYCSGFTGSLTIPNSVTSIGQHAFRYCNGFTGNLTISNSVTTIGSCAFANCSGFIGCLTIGNSVTMIAEDAFSGCSNVEQIIVQEGNAYYDSRDNCNAIIETATNTLLWGCKNTIIPSTVSSLGMAAFYGCSELTSFSIPNNITSIGISPFAFCNNLEYIVVEQGNPVYDSRNNCNAIIETDSNSLIAGCKNTVIPNSVTSIGMCAFYGCYNMTSIDIPDSITTIGYMAFFSCSSLSYIMIPESVVFLGIGTFCQCLDLGTIVVLGATPPTIEYDNLFVPNHYPSPDYVNLIVSCGNKEAYENSGWAANVTSIEEDCSQHSVNINENGMTGGNVSTSVNLTELGEEVQLTITPDEGMELASLIVCNANNPEQMVPVYPIGRDNSMYGFIMPPFDVMITATFSPTTTIGENSEVLVSVYPNPTDNKAMIETENLKHVSISNMLGQFIYESETSGNAFEYDFSKHKEGIYLIRIETASGVAVKKISVTH